MAQVKFHGAEVSVDPRNAFSVALARTGKVLKDSSNWWL